jgi:hypothetical protein
MFLDCRWEDLFDSRHLLLRRASDRCIRIHRIVGLSGPPLPIFLQGIFVVFDDQNSFPTAHRSSSLCRSACTLLHIFGMCFVLAEENW